jgi:PAS domain-containing protein
MDLSVYFKSIVEQDRNAVVICNLDHEIIYMNPAAIAHFAKRGGEQLVGQSLLACHNAHSCDQIIKTVQWFAEDQSHNIIHTMYNEKQNKDIYMVALRDETGALIGYYEKHEYRNPETEATYNFQ